MLPARSGSLLRLRSIRMAPNVPLPSRQFSPDAVPLPNSFVGTNPVTKSAFAAPAASTYCFAAACSGAVGFPLNVSGPVIAPPAVGKKFPAPTVAIEESTYALFAISRSAHRRRNIWRNNKALRSRHRFRARQMHHSSCHSPSPPAQYSRYCIDTG